MPQWTTFTINRTADFSPSNAGTTGQYLQRTATGYQWATLSGLSATFEGLFDIVRSTSDVPATATVNDLLFVSSAISSLTGKASFRNKSGSSLSSLSAQTWYKGTSTLNPTPVWATITTGNAPSKLSNEMFTVALERTGGIAAQNDVLVAGGGTSSFDPDNVYVFKRASNSWQSTYHATPSGTRRSPGLAVKSNGDWVLVGGTNNATIYSRSSGSGWSSVTTVPSGVTVGDIAVDGSNNILLLDTTARRIRTYNGTTWNSPGLAVPTAATSPNGITVRSNGNILLADNTTKKIYTYNGSSWDNGAIAYRTSSTLLYALGIDSNGDVYGATRRRIEEYAAQPGAAHYKQIDAPVGAVAQELIDGNVGSGFDLHEDVTVPATIEAADRIVFSDESASGDPMRYTTFSKFKAALLIDEFAPANTGSTGDVLTKLSTGYQWSTPSSFSPGNTGTTGQVLTRQGQGYQWQDIPDFDIHDDVTTSATIASTDRIVFSDESASGDPMRYTTFANFKTALDITEFSPGNTGTTGQVLTRQGQGYQWRDIPDFDIHDDVTTSATIASADRIIFSDEGTTGDPMRYTTFASFKTALDITEFSPGNTGTTGQVLTRQGQGYQWQTISSGSFDIHDDVTTSATIASTDRLVFSDESASGDPMRYTTFANFKTALDITEFSPGNTGTTGQVLTRQGQGYQWANAASVNFKLHDVTALATTLATTDYLLFSDESASGDPNTRITFSNFKNALDITEFSPGNTGTTGQVLTRQGQGYQWQTISSGSFDIHDDVTTSATIASTDRIVFSDESASGDPMRYTTFANFKTALDITEFSPGNTGTTGQVLTRQGQGYQWRDIPDFDIHDDVTGSATIADADRIIFSDEGTFGDPMRYTTFANFKTALDIPSLPDAPANLSAATYYRLNVPKTSGAAFWSLDKTPNPPLLQPNIGPRQYLLQVSGTTPAGYSWLLYDGFNIHDDVTGVAPGNVYISNADRLIFSDEGRVGAPNTYVTFENFKKALGLDMHIELTQGKTIRIRYRFGSDAYQYTNYVTVNP